MDIGFSEPRTVLFLRRSISHLPFFSPTLKKSRYSCALRQADIGNVIGTQRKLLLPSYLVTFEKNLTMNSILAEELQGLVIN